MDKRSLTIAGHRTSLALEAEFWTGLEEIAAARGLTLPRLIAEIDRTRRANNLASAVRLTVLDHYRGEPQSARRPEAVAEAPAEAATAFREGY